MNGKGGGTGARVFFGRREARCQNQNFVLALGCPRFCVQRRRPRASDLELVNAGQPPSQGSGFPISAFRVCREGGTKRIFRISNPHGLNKKHEGHRRPEKQIKQKNMKKQERNTSVCSREFGTSGLVASFLVHFPRSDTIDFSRRV